MSSLRKTVAADVETPPPTADIDVTTIALTAATGGAAVPFTVGHGFRQGDVPLGRFIKCDVANAHGKIQATWPDGSAKFAIVSGTATMSTGVPLTVTLRHSQNDVGGAALTTTQLAAAMPTVTITGGAHTTTLNSLLASPQRTVVSGAHMSNWLYRHPVAGSNHLVVWVDVRYYASGAIEIFPWVENAYLLVASPTNDVRIWTVSINGSQRFSQSIDIRHHTRIPLITGRVDGYWVGTDHGVVPSHNTTYLRATKLVPNYNWTAPSAATLNALTQAYTPGDWAGVPLMNSSGGDSAAILGFTARAPDVLYCATADARAYRGALAMSFAGGSWDVHHRDHNTNEHIKFSDYPTISYQTGTYPLGTGGSSNWGATGSRTSHQMSRGYLAWLISGRWWHLDEAIFWATQNYLYQSPSARENAAGIIKTNAGANTDRGAAWGLRQLAQALALLPSSHPMHAELKASWEANTQWYLAAVTSGQWANNLGMFPKYGTYGISVYGYYSGYADFACWMQMMVVGVLGYTWDLGLPQASDSAIRHQQIRDHGYKMAVGLCGDGSAGETNYRWFGPYAAPYAANGSGSPIFTSWRQVNDVVTATTGVSIPTGNNLYRHGTATLWPSNDATYMTSYFGQHFLALSYATDHGAPGAASAWLRVSGAQNYNSVTAQFNDFPQYGVAPRGIAAASLPAHITNAAEGQWTAIGSNTLASVGFNYSGWPLGGQYITNLQSIMNAWSGGTYDPTAHKLYVNGGGHNDYDGNEWYAFNLATNTWARLDNPSAYAEENFASGWNGIYPDNAPLPIHTYDILCANPTTGKLYRLGRSGSFLLRIQEFNPALATQQGVGVTKTSWAHRATISWTDGHSGTSAWMSDEGQFLIGHQDGGTFIHFRRYNPTTDTVSAQINGAGFYSGDMAMAYSPSRRLAALHRGSNSLVILNTATNVAALQTVTGATLPVRCGMEYDSVRDVFMAYTDEGADRRVLYSINPSTWVATQISPSAGATIGGVAAGYRGIYGRFAYCADYDVYIAVNSVTGNVYLYKPTGWSPP